jgi:S1-C subfamily serine protease
MKTTGKIFVAIMAMIFLASCCGRKHPNYAMGLGNGDHPLNPTTSYFIYQRISMWHPRLQQPAEIEATSGSGVAIRGGNKYTDILTAGHVCMMPPEIKAMGGIQAINLFDIHGEQFVGEVYAIDEANDLCIIRMNEERPKIKLASQNPNIGDRVFSGGYPSGWYKPGILHFFEGYFGGIDDTRSGNYSFPAAPGSSGSAIVNARGELIGLVSAVIVDFHHITIGPSVEPISIFLLLSEDCDKFCI